MNRLLKQTLVAAAIAVSALSAQAASAVLSTGVIKMGVADNAGLGALGVGFDSPVGGDSIIRGCLCEGWGASAGGVSGNVYGASNIAGISSSLLTTTVASGSGLDAKSVVTMTNGLEVTHAYSYVSDTLFKVTVTLKNTTAGSLSDVRYARVLDWDVDPGFFASNFTTVYGGTPSGPGGKVLHTSTNPFVFADPLNPPTENANTNVTNLAGDLGSFFVFGFGSLAAGASETFDTFIGAESTVSQLLASFTSAGVEAYSFTTGNATGRDGSTAPAYGYGFAGLDLPPIGTTPTPGALLLSGLALVALGATRRRATPKA